MFDIINMIIHYNICACTCNCGTYSICIKPPLNPHTDVYSRARGLKFGLVFIYTHTLCIQAANALMSLHIWARLTSAFVVQNAKNTKISWCGFVELKRHFFNTHNIVINDHIYDSNIYQALISVGYSKVIFLFSQPKHMLWVLKRTVSMRLFF